MPEPMLITGLKQLLTFRGPKSPRCGPAMRNIGLVNDGAVLIENGIILAAGPAAEVMKHPAASAASDISVRGVALPGFVDSHSHPVFVGSRLTDFSMRIRGESYVEIKKKGGGIISSIAAVRWASQSDLEDDLRQRALRFIECGTTTLEAKSGYGLSLESEEKMLKVIVAIDREGGLELVPTLLAAHSVPPEFKGDCERYLNYVIKEILPEISSRKLAVFCDVFCEKGYFTARQSRRLLEAAKRFGLKPKIHAEQLSNSGGAKVAADVKAVSADHLDFVDARDISLMKKSRVVGTLLPACNYFLGTKRYPPARKMMDSGLPVALATDFNPGSAPCWNMQMVISIACTQMKMTPEEALTASTVNGAHALGLAKRLGTIEPGKQADIIVMDADDYREIAYYFGDNQCAMTIKRGAVVYDRHHAAEGTPTPHASLSARGGSASGEKWES